MPMNTKLFWYWTTGRMRTILVVRLVSVDAAALFATCISAKDINSFGLQNVPIFAGFFHSLIVLHEPRNVKRYLVL